MYLGSGILRAESFNSNGVNIGYMIKGHGDPVVLIHGLFSSYAINWQLPGIIDLQAKDYQIVAVDMPSFGTWTKVKRISPNTPDCAEIHPLLIPLRQALPGRRSRFNTDSFNRGDSLVEIPTLSSRFWMSPFFINVEC